MRSIVRAVLAVLIILIAATVIYAASCCSSGTTCSSTPKVFVQDNTLSNAEKADNWQLLFDGKTFNNWQFTNPDRKGWVIDDNAIHCNALQGGMMASMERFGNFELQIDFKVDHGTNSGVFFRWDKLNDPVQTGFEMQILDNTNDEAKGKKHSCGALYDVLEPNEDATKPATQWNHVLIRCKDSFVFIYMNDKRIITADLNRYTQPHKNLDGTDNKFNTAYKDMAREGYIGLQDHGGKVWYKNIKIRSLK